MKKLLTILLVLTGMVCTASADTYKVYFRPNSTWAADSPNFGLYMFNSNTDNSFQLFEAVGTTGAYSASFDTSYSKVIVVRLKTGETTLGDGWSNRTAQSGDLTAPTADKTYYDMADKIIAVNKKWSLNDINVRNLSQSWYIAGGRHITNGFHEWGSSADAQTANAMTTTDNQNFTLTVSKRPIKAGTYHFKFVGDDWVGDGSAYDATTNPNYDYLLTIANDGVYDITYSFNQLSRSGSFAADKDDSDQSTISYKYYVYDENSYMTGQGWWLNELTANGETNTIAYTTANPVDLKYGTTYRYKVVEQIYKGDVAVNTYWPWNSENDGWWTVSFDKTRAYNITFKFYKNANYQMTTGNPLTTTDAVTTGYYIMYDNGSGWVPGNHMTESSGVYTGTITGLGENKYFAILPASGLPTTEGGNVTWTNVVRPNATKNVSVTWSNSNSGTTTTTNNNQVWTNGIDDATTTLELTYNSSESTWSVAPYYAREFKSAAEGYATFSAKLAVAIPEHITAKYATDIDGTGITWSSNLTSGIPANTGVLLHSDEITTANKTYKFTPATTTDAIGTNLLEKIESTSLINQTDGDYTNFILSKVDDTLGFYKVNASGSYCGAGTAYLQILTTNVPTAREFFALFDDEDGQQTDGINAAQVNVISGTAYNLAGQKVDADYKGIIIVNGKKYLRK